MLDPALTRRPVHPVLWALVGIMFAIELMFAAVEAGYATPLLSRYHVYAVFAFADPYFEAALAGHVTTQFLWTLLTHAFLHGGWLHFGLNAAALLGLGHAITSVAGIRATLAIFVVSAVAGALCFALITDFRGPMVGASGVVFGFLGTVTAWQERALRLAGQSRQEVWNRILGLVLINVALNFGLGGALAWEAHLGGFIGGWVMAYRYPPALGRRAPA